MPAHSSYIIVKDGDKGRRVSYKEFYGPLDKGAAKPSFCYPQRREELKEEIDRLQKALDSGYIAKEREMENKTALKSKKDRLDKIDEQESAARKLFSENKDKWLERRASLEEEIRTSTPTMNEVVKRKVNPHKVLKNEMSGLRDKKTEYIVISRLAGEESNVSFLQKEK